MELDQREQTFLDQNLLRQAPPKPAIPAQLLPEATPPSADRLSAQEVETAMMAISQIIPVLELHDCLKIVQWATERAATAQITQVSAATSFSRSPALSLVESRVEGRVENRVESRVESQANRLADQLEEDDDMLPLHLDLSELDLDGDRWDLSIAPPTLDNLNETHFSIPILSLVGEPPEDLPLAM